MKTKVTNKQIRTNYNKVYAIGYCDAYYLLSGISPFAYNCGVYGWNSDFYYIDNICISTGYRPIGEHIDFNLLHNYETKAKNTKSFEKRNELLKEFLSKLN